MDVLGYAVAVGVLGALLLAAAILAAAAGGSVRFAQRRVQRLRDRERSLGAGASLMAFGGISLIAISLIVALVGLLRVVGER